jgi:hypothetical protein
MLFLQGTRDALADLTLMRRLIKRPGKLATPARALGSGSLVSCSGTKRPDG